MIVGIGCDIVEHQTTERLEWASNGELLQRIFSKKELDIYQVNKSLEFIAGRFAAKEAVVKCLGTGMQDGISLVDIQTLQSKSGKPVIKLKGKVKKISNRLGILSWHVSITHTTTYSCAFAIAEGDRSSFASS